MDIRKVNADIEHTGVRYPHREKKKKRKGAIDEFCLFSLPKYRGGVGGGATRHVTYRKSPVHTFSFAITGSSRNYISRVAVASRTSGDRNPST